MNADRLFSHFDRIAGASDAVPRLRHFILDLAVRGKLVEQDPNDEPASELLKRIAAEKTRRAKQGKVRVIASILSGSPFESDFPIPAAWKSVRLAELSNIVMGQSPPSETYNTYGEGVPLINGPVEFSDGPFGMTVANQYTTAPTNSCDKGDFLICVRGSTTGRSNIAAFDACIGRGVAAIQPLFGDSFVRLFLWSMRERIISMGRGIAFPSITRKQLENLLVPLPPLAEQHRIVAKVDELMSVCDRLEVALAEREATQDRLTAASLIRLNAPDLDPAIFQNHAAFTLENLDPLSTRLEQIKALRQTILNLAVHGKLVPQDPNDEPASELLKRIAKEKARLVKVREIRKPKAISTLLENDMPFPLPANWRWSRIAEIGVLSPRNDAEDHLQTSFVPMSMIASRYGLATDHQIRRWGEIKSGYTHFSEGDVGLAKITPCFENGKSAVFRNLTGGLGSGTTELHIVRPLFVDSDFVLIFLKCPHFIEAGIPTMTGTAGQKRVPTEYFANASFPLPPFAEQHRIVAKVDELMSVCDRLEASLAAGDDTRCRLLDVLLHEALAPNEEESGSIIPTIAQKVPDKPSGSPKVLTKSTPIRT